MSAGISGETSLAKSIAALRPALAEQAQRVYDCWDEDGRGVCAQVTQAFAELLAKDLDPDVEVFVLDLEGDGPPHTVCFVETAAECLTIDLPYERYEEPSRSGQQWVWKRKPGVVFRADDVVVSVEETS